MSNIDSEVVQEIVEELVEEVVEEVAGPEKDSSEVIQEVFLKTGKNLASEKAGLKVLRQDPHIQVLDLETKKRVIELLPAGDWGIKTFDAVRTPEPDMTIDRSNIDEHFEKLVLIEQKTTRKPIKNAALNKFWFGATAYEYALAELLGDRYLLLFVVVNSHNDYEKPFFVLLTLEQVEQRTRKRRVQFQVNFRTDMSDMEQSNSGMGPENSVSFGGR